MVVAVSGRVDSANAPDFQEALRTAGSSEGQAMILDFGELAYISSAGLRAILMTARILREEAPPLAVCSLLATILEIFEISGFSKILAVCETPDAAAAHVGG